MKDFVLRNGIKHPILGFGTYQLPPGESTYQAVLSALKHGARHIDTSVLYKNEEDVGRAIRDSNIPREEIFITAKLPPHVKKRSSVRRFFERSLKKLGVDYIDAYIINAPGPFDDLSGNYDEENIEAYTELEALYHEELVASIGVSQFQVHHLKNIIDHCNIVPHINQISYFVGHTQDEIVEFCQKHKILIQGFSPLAKGYLLENPVLKTISETYQKHPSQIALRYVIQKGVASIPKASKIEHIKLNYDMDFVLADHDIKTLDSIKDDPRKYHD